MHDIFDVEFAAEIGGAVAIKVWNGLPEELVEKMVDSALNHIQIAELDLPPSPPTKEGDNQETKRVYSNRRGLALVKENSDKRRSRRTALKCGSKLYVSYL